MITLQRATASRRWLASWMAACGVVLAVLVTIQPLIAGPPPSAETLVLQASTFDQKTAEVLLHRLADGMQGHSLPRARSAFDLRRFPAAFAENMSAAFDHYESFRLFYRILQADPEQEEKGIAWADLTLESLPRQSDAAPLRKHFQLKIQAQRVAVGKNTEWRIVALDPQGALFSF